MEGLIFLSYVPERASREQFQLLRDDAVYDIVKQLASVSDMRDIDGWSRSFYTIEGHLEAIEQYRKPLIPEPGDASWQQAKRTVRNELINTIPTVTSLRFEDEIDLVHYESSSSAGYGYQGKKGEGNNFNRAKRIANALVRQYVEDRQQYGLKQAEQQLAENSTPDVAFTRTQLAKLPSIKVRNIFGEAFHYILIEGLSAFPLLAAFRREDSFYLTGKDPTSYVPQYLVSLDQLPGWIITLDWSKFDATVQLWEINHAFNCIEQILYFPTELSKAAFEVSKELFKHRKLAGPDGRLWMRHSGIPSGSYYTNIIGSIINYTRLHYICNAMGYRITSCRVQGDDSVIKVHTNMKPDISAMADVAARHGWVMNPLKCTVAHLSEGITFLGRSQLQLFNIRERLKVLRLMCFPEYKVDNPQISTARARMIASDAGFRDPLYNKIVYGLNTMYGEANSIPSHLLPFTELIDWQDVNM